VQRPCRLQRHASVEEKSTVQLSSNVRGAIFMSISMAGFTANDALTKAVMDNMSMAQVMLLRGLFATLLITLYAWSQNALRNPALALHPMVLLRAAGEMGATLCFLTALSHLPLANISAVLQALPLAVTMGAALFLAEPVGWRRWLAIGIGFLGVLVIVRPGADGFNEYTLLALLCVCFCAVRDIATRKVPAEIPSLFLSTMTAAMVTAAGAVLLVPYGGWEPTSVTDVSLLMLAAVLLLFGYQFIIVAMREGDISFIAPFRYTALLWAIVLGYLAFAEFPDTPTLIGAGIIVASGLYTLYRERIVSRQRPAAESTGEAMAPDGL
jgi:drug/metabolite transporter (DMT)-like permease